MNVRWLSLVALLALLAGLLPAGIVAAAPADDGQYKFYGTVEALPASGLVGDWVVSGRTVHVSTFTRIEQEHGPVTVGAYVEVKGTQQADGSIDATKIEVKQGAGGGGGGNTGSYIKLYGTVEALPTSGLLGDWVVSGRTVHVTAATIIGQEHGAVAVGAYVEVKGTQQADGSIDATKIEVKNSFGGGGSGYIEFYGTIESLPDTTGWVGDWVVSGRTLHVTAATIIEQEHGAVAVGAYVDVKGAQQADGSVDATKIEVKQGPGGGGGGGDGSVGFVKFYGTVEALPASGLVGDWVVSGRTVHVSTFTRIEQEHGPVTVGAYVKVKGNQQADGSVNATKVEVKQSIGGGGGEYYAEFYGTVEALPASGLVGDWVVSGRTVHVSTFTRIEQEHGPVTVGAYVKVKGNQQADGSVNATRIEVKRGAGGGGGGAIGYVKFYGAVEALPAGGLVGDWVVGGQLVHVTAATIIEQEHGTVAVGARVEVKGIRQADGSVNAIKIEVKS